MACCRRLAIYPQDSDVQIRRFAAKLWCGNWESLGGLRQKNAAGCGPVNCGAGRGVVVGVRRAGAQTAMASGPRAVAAIKPIGPHGWSRSDPDGTLPASVVSSRLLIARLIHAFDGSEVASISADQAQDDGTSGAKIFPMASESLTLSTSSLWRISVAPASISSSRRRRVT